MDQALLEGKKLHINFLNIKYLRKINDLVIEVERNIPKAVRNLTNARQNNRNT